jgi:hypothetical protein
VSLGGLLLLLLDLLLDVGDAAIGFGLLDFLEVLHQLEPTFLLPLLLVEFLLSFLLIRGGWAFLWGGGLGMRACSGLGL